MNSNFNIFTAAVLIRSDSPGTHQKTLHWPSSTGNECLSLSNSNNLFFSLSHLTSKYFECQFLWQPSMKCGNVRKFMTVRDALTLKSVQFLHASRWEALVPIIGKSVTTRSGINCSMLYLPHPPISAYACDRENAVCYQSKTLSYQERWQFTNQTFTRQHGKYEPLNACDASINSSLTPSF